MRTPKEAIANLAILQLHKIYLQTDKAYVQQSFQRLTKFIKRDWQMTQDNEPARLEAALIALTQSVQVLIEETRVTNTNINSLVEHLYTRNDVVANDVVDIKNELYEFKEVFKQQALTADRYASAAQAQALAAQAQAESVKVQSDTAKTQAENIRLMIEMLNRKQA
ncbi:hypothetical protein [Pseudanabaena sp. 'Roaring Creek']|uniref:hypothetical protein n=1 Tax=Pseudanabaena sp. 'Roaring Creek' TaxID=1681830 RepID=UPI0006D77D60|nr:hypothetical protein [Pseudanabaena sp. 'Roaring Creek']